MTKTPYRVGEGANLRLYPRGTKVGSIVMLTEAEALYERDMGRLAEVKTKGRGKEEITPPATSDGSVAAEKPQDVRVAEADGPVGQVEQARIEAARRRR